MYLVWLVLVGLAVFALDFVGGGQAAKLRIGGGLSALLIGAHLFFRIRQGGAAALLCPDCLFACVYGAFMQGYVWLWALGVAEYSDQIFLNEDTLWFSQFLVLVGLISYLFAYEASGVVSRGTGETYAPPRIPPIGWGAAGAAILILGILMHVGTLFSVGIHVVLTYGYAALASLGEYVGGLWPLIWGRSPEVILLGILIYSVYSGLRFGRLFGNPMMMAVVGGMVLLYVVEGDRGPIFLIATVLLLVRHYLIKPMKWYLVGGAAVGLLLLFGAMGVAREWAMAPERMLNEVQQARSEGELRWYSPIAEAGGSFRVVNATTMLVPTSEPYWRGASWLSALPKAIPFLSGYLSRQGLLAEAPSSWLTLTMVGSGRAGWGFALPAEGYLNFGVPGVVMELAAFGILMRLVCIWYAREPSVFRAFIMLGILAPAIKVVRDHVGSVANVYPLVILFAVFLKMLIGVGQYHLTTARQTDAAETPPHPVTPRVS